MTWSPDGKILALANTVHLRIVSIEGAELNVLQNPAPECRIPVFELPPSITFTSDGSALWAGCGIDDAQTSIVGAIKLSVPTLQVIDKIVFPLPEFGKRTGAYSYRMQVVGTSVVMSSILLSFDDTPTGPKEIRSYLNVYDLETRRQMFPYKRIFAPKSEPLAFANKLAFGTRKVGTMWSISSARHAVEIMAIDSHDQAVALGDEEELEGAETDNLYFVAEGKLLIGTLRSGSPTIGGLVVWDAQNGKVMQHVKSGSVFLSALSQDGQMMVTTVGSDLNFYRIMQ